MPFFVGEQVDFYELQKQSAKYNFAARQVESLTFEDGETIHLIATWKPYVNAVHEHMSKKLARQATSYLEENHQWVAQLVLTSKPKVMEEKAENGKTHNAHLQVLG